MTNRITIKTDADAFAYLADRGITLVDVKEDKSGNAYVIREHVCKRCGGTGGGHWYQDGGICYECHGKNSRYNYAATVVGIAKSERKLELRIAAKVRKAERKNAAFEERAANARTEFDAAYPGVGAKLADATHTILVDLREKLDKWGSLSAAQVGLIEKLTAEANAPKTSLEGGRREVTGTIVSCKYRDSAYGGAWKIVLDLGDGTRIWGSLPGNVETLLTDHYYDTYKGTETIDFSALTKGATLTLTATITVSDDDVSFGFYKRPSKATLDAIAWVAPEPPAPREVDCEFCGSYRHGSHDCPAEAAHCERVEEAFR